MPRQNKIYVKNGHWQEKKPGMNFAVFVFFFELIECKDSQEPSEAKRQTDSFLLGVEFSGLLCNTGQIVFAHPTCCKYTKQLSFVKD